MYSRGLAAFLALTFLITVTGSALAMEVVVEPINEANILVGQEFSVNLNINDAESVSGYELGLFYSPQVLEVLGVEEQEWLRSAGQTDFLVGLVNNQAGSVTGIRAVLLEGEVKSGAGTLASIRFRAKELGSSELRLAEPKIFGPNNQLMGPVQSINSSFSISNTPPVEPGEIKPNEWKPPSAGEALKEVRTGSGQVGAVGPAAWSMFLKEWQPQLYELTQKTAFLYAIATLLIILIIFVFYRSRH